jgi:mono/diheme cytochrome c family protein
MVRKAVARALILTGLLIPVAALAADGEALFDASCAACHQHGGTGSAGLAPPLVDKALWDRLGSAAAAYIQGVMLAGLSGSIEVDGQQYVGLVMPSQGRMTDDELAAIGTYVLSTLNAVSRPKLTATTVAMFRSAPPTHAALREMRKTGE